MICMKKIFKSALCLTATLVMASSAFAAEVELYSLDGRTLNVDESQVEIYTAEGMGWFKEKPVTMYSLDGREIVVSADRVEAHKLVGWFVKGEDSSAPSVTEPSVTQPVEAATVSVKYTDGTVVKVPEEHLETYKTLGWALIDNKTSEATEVVTVYNSEGVAKEIPADELGKYQLEGWSLKKADVSYVTVYNYAGEERQILSSQVEIEKTNGWYPAFDEAVYSYAAFGDGFNVKGATKLLEEKSYEAAFLLVQDAIKKIENTSSEYTNYLYYLRTTITDTWREAANSPLGFVNYWFSEKDGKKIVVFEYRNISNSRIKSFRINFDICNSVGEVIETNSGSYYAENLEMPPCEKQRVAWYIQSNNAASIKNLKVKEVTFSDGTVWPAAE